MSDKLQNGILFPKGTKSLCLIGSDFGEKGTLIKGKEYYHPEHNCITDENGKDLFIPTVMIHHFKNLGESSEVPEMKTKKGVSIDDHLNAIELLKKHFEKEEIMSNKQLPPELVEKMSQHVDLYNNKGQIDHDLSWKRAKKCAQIAVDYADEQNLSLKTELNFCSEEINILKQQRDELIYFIKLIYKDLDSGDMRIPLIRSTRRHELYELLKKHEDGKE